ncbi:hypothetical protein HYR99_18515 [Candidatus Poribacteria bacterium]|nr:hypothetical protein [Candidatus Poribacteria bacterium]
MGKTISLVTAAWFCFRTLAPPFVMAQTEHNPVERGEISDHRPVLEPSEESEMTPSSEPENLLPEAAEEAELPRHIIRVGDNFNLGATKIVDSITLAIGNAKIRGHVIGDIFVFAGDVAIQDSAQILGRVTVVLGKIKGLDHLLKANATESKASLYREINGWRLVPATIDLMMHPERAWGSRGDSEAQGLRFGWELLIFVTLTFTHILLVTVFPKQMSNMAYTVSHRLIGSTVLGLIVLIIIPYLALLLILSIVGIPLMMLLLAVLLPMAIYGKTSIFLAIGNAILPRQPNTVAVVVGYWVYRIVIAIPYIHYFAFLVGCTIGLGICIRTAFGQKSMQPHKDYRKRYTIPKYLSEYGVKRET